MPTTPQHIIFDMDDTLIHCNKYFDLILGDYLEWMTKWFQAYEVTTEAIRTKQAEIDVAGVHKLGFASANFPQSLIDTYHYFSSTYGRAQSALEEQQVYALGLSVYEQEIEAYPGMVETLAQLQSGGHHLHLYTGGESSIQERKIEQMKLAGFFEDRIYIRQHKDIEALEEILTLGSFNRTDTWMIGNSLRTDVVPALQAGINSIYIKQQREWHYNLVELKEEAHNILYTVSLLTEVPRIIEKHLS
ncbi:HAD family hydrolase [Paenibacillus sp. JCM 10914]|uniref:HAD family hydrolase n=1 Tax=Paenibacillus sp. JCM 10914 TaxID=1236974 RepID=UPI0003CC4AF0|nr:HAD family hydrolase [Paenibacillus sp. JCM 10914]GAE05391.1 hydrolase, haloacid delahogenase-like family [Paenibacillus sp. JCM 10914]